MNPVAQDGKAAAAPQLGLRLRAVVSLLLLFHLAALVVAPMAVRPSSMLSGYAWTLFQPYLEAAYLNHGYHFFGPEPGPGHLVRYEIELPDGTKKRGFFPNPREHKPRLLYHRHFMLSERLAPLMAEDSAVPPGERRSAEGFARSYAEHLLQQHRARRVTLYLRRHLLPWPEQVDQGMMLDDPKLYEERKLISLVGDGK